MNQEEFFNLSTEEVKAYNGSTSVESHESWRLGFTYAVRQVEFWLNNCYQDELFENLEELVKVTELEIRDYGNRK